MGTLEKNSKLTKTLLKLLSVLSIVLIGFIVLRSSVQAQSFNLNPNTGTVAIGETLQIDLVAIDPPANTNTARLRMSIGNNFRITNFTTGQNVLLLGCASGSTFSDQTICVDWSSSEDITDNQTLATITIEAVSNGSDVELTFDAQNGYTSVVTYTGVGGTYTAGQGGTTSDPCNVATNRPLTCACTSNAQCGSNNCTNSVCSPTVPVGGGTGSSGGGGGNNPLPKTNIVNDNYVPSGLVFGTVLLLTSLIFFKKGGIIIQRSLYYTTGRSFNEDYEVRVDKSKK